MNGCNMTPNPCILSSGTVEHEPMTDELNHVVFLPFNFQAGRNDFVRKSLYKIACCSRCLCFYAMSMDDVNSLALKGRVKR